MISKKCVFGGVLAQATTLGLLEKNNIFQNEPVWSFDRVDMIVKGNEL